MRVALPSLTLATTLLACGGAPPAAPTVPAPPEPPAPAPESASPAALPVDLGPKPAMGKAPEFTPPVPQILNIPGLPTVWLIARHGLPLVTLEIAVDAGSADDPQGKAGLAALTAEMMEQGAGRYGSLEISRLFEQLGAEASVSANVDHSTASLRVLKPNLKRALELMGDVVARPRFEAGEWKRSQALWLDQLEQRPFEPADVAAVVARAVFHGPAHPYGHPVDGHSDTVKSLTLGEVKAFHQTRWRPDRATMIVVGDVSVEELKALFVPAFSSWVPQKGKPTTRAFAAPSKGPWPRTVLVDRPGAAQTMFLLVAPGPAVADPAQTPLQLANIPLGGSFTSRLNSNLREDKGYTYGVRSAVAQDRLSGRWTIRTAVESSVTGPALKEILKELDGLRTGGLTPGELQKARATERGDMVSSYESLEPIAERLATNAALGLGADWDVRLGKQSAAVTDAAIDRAARDTPLSQATIIAVGDGKTIRDALKAASLPEPEVRDPDGRLVGAGAKK